MRTSGRRTPKAVSRPPALPWATRTVAGWSAGEDELARSLPALAGRVVGDLRQKILAGDDPLGDLFCSLRSPEVRRKQGATFTPKGIVDAMVDWAARAVPQRVIDPGVGSGRFLVAAGRRFAARVWWV